LELRMGRRDEKKKAQEGHDEIASHDQAFSGRDVLSVRLSINWLKFAITA
jgi:hypothetical protein